MEGAEKTWYAKYHNPSETGLALEEKISQIFNSQDLRAVFSKRQPDLSNLAKFIEALKVARKCLSQKKHDINWELGYWNRWINEEALMQIIKVRGQGFIDDCLNLVSQILDMCEQLHEIRKKYRQATQESQKKVRQEQVALENEKKRQKAQAQKARMAEGRDDLIESVYTMNTLPFIRPFAKKSNLSEQEGEVGDDEIVEENEKV